MKPCYLEPDFWTLKTVSVDLRQKQKDIIQVLKKKILLPTSQPNQRRTRCLNNQKSMQ